MASLILNTLEQGTSYEFQVIAKGNGSTYDNSDASSSVQWTTQAKLATPVITTTKDTNSITVNWSTIANATGYVVEYKLSTTSESAYQALNVNAPTTSKTIESLTSGATYNIRVKAVSTNTAYVDSNYSTVATVVVSTQLDTPNPTYSSDTSSITATWSAIQHAASYKVFYKKSTDSTYSSDTVTASANPTWTKSGLTSGTVYSVYVQAIGSGDYADSDNSTATNVTVKTKISAPTNLAISDRTTNSLTLTWGNVPNNAGYQVYYKKGNGSYGTPVTKAANATSHQLTGLGEGESYTFYVVAIGSGNYVDSDNSATVTGTTKITLAAPTGLAADNVLSTTADINWNKTANATGYKITVSDANGAITGYNNRALGDVNTLSIAGLTQTKEYTVSLVATSTSDDYVDSPAASLVFTTDTKLGTVSTPTLTKTTDSITIDWSPVSAADSYLVQYRETGSGDSGWQSEPVPGSANPPCKFKLSPLAQGASYQFRVKAVTNNPAYEDGDYSEIVSTATLIKLNTPTGLNVTNIQLTEATLNWNDVEHNSGYTVKYRKVGTSEWITREVE